MTTYSDRVRWIIGDIHGMLRPLEAVLAVVRAADPQARLYFAGDYVNRGPDSRKVVDLLLSLEGARFIRGNHDDIFDQILSGLSYTCGRGDDERLMAFESFMRFGLEHTFLSYGEEWADLELLVRRPKIDKLDQLIRSVPEAHRKFFRELPLVVEEDDLFIAHARFDPAEPTEGLSERLLADERMRHRVLWGRFDWSQIIGPKVWKRTGYFGHTPTSIYDDRGRRGPRPLAGPRIVLVDTGAFDPSGRLTAFCADAGTFVQADHFGNLVESK